MEILLRHGPPNWADGGDNLFHPVATWHLRPSRPSHGGSPLQEPGGFVCWLVVYLPLWKIWKSVGMMTFPIYGKIKNVQSVFFHSPESMDWREKMNRKPSIFPLRYIWGFPVVKTNPLTEQLGYFGMVPRTEHHRRRGTCIIQQVMVQGFGSWNRWLVSYKVNELNVYV